MITSRMTQLRRSSLLMGALLAVASLLLTACGGSAAGSSGNGVLIGVAFPSQAQERVGFETNVVQLHQVLAVKLDSHGRDGGLPLRPWWTP